MNYDSTIPSAGIIPLRKERGNWQVLLIQYRGYEQFWGCPKGHLNANETHLMAACRELKEETALSVKHLIQNTPLLEEFIWLDGTVKKHKRILFFLALVEGDLQLQTEELSDGQWFPLSDAIEKIIYPEGKRLLQEVKSILNHP